MAEYIEREAAIRVVKGQSSLTMTRSSLIDSISKLSAADVAPVVHGHFVYDGTRFAGGVEWWYCSNCGGMASGVETRFVYCPKCGARMDGGDDGETD